MNSTRAFVTMVLRHLLRDRSALFFMLALPVAIIVIIGSTFGTEPRTRVGVVATADSAVSDEVIERIQDTPGLEIRRFDSDDALRGAVRRFEIAAGVVLPERLDVALARGETVEVTVIGDPTSVQAAAARAAVERSVDRSGGRAAAAQVVAGEVGLSVAEARAALREAPVRDTTVQIDDVGEALVGDLSPFALTAPQNLVLFVFINTLGAGALLVRSRRVGVLRRVIATPTSAARIVAGLGAGWAAVALVQSAIILVVGRVGFGVQWGDPPAVVALVLAFAAVGAMAGLLIGAIGRNEDRVGAMTPVIGLVLGALGGCMTPIEVFPPAMVTVARATPHFWAMRGWRSLIFEGGGLRDVLGDVVVLAVFAAVLGAAAVWRLRRDLTGAGGSETPSTEPVSPAPA